MKTLQTLLIAAFALFSSPLFGDEMKKGVALGGYCPVCYIAAGKPVKGTSEFKVEHEKKTYYFVSQDAVDAFTKEPAKFLPAYDGYCAFGIAHGKKFESDPTVFKVIDGVIYLNKDKEIGAKFAEDTEGFITKANATWKKMEMEMAKKKEMMKK